MQQQQDNLVLVHLCVWRGAGGGKRVSVPAGMEEREVHDEENAEAWYLLSARDSCTPALFLLCTMPNQAVVPHAWPTPPVTASTRRPRNAADEGLLRTTLGAL